jgi:hypothetical protein
MSIAPRYRVDISDSGGPSRSWCRRGLTLPQAWRIVRRQARRGFRLHGGSVAYGNWGARGGLFPARYRSAVIRVDVIPGTGKHPKPV